ncbi:MAG: DUF1549 domain-containing protein, partial [Saprospiraceae bacterium]|nr:DUF1549 domain-containing protein [Saprospiraceae bacterium]
MVTFLPTTAVAFRLITSATAAGIFLFGSSCQNLSDNHISVALPDRVDFNFHVKPILSDRCFKCHGPDEDAREADLRFDVKENALAPLDSADLRFAILPGKSEQSEMIKRISSTDPEYMMPPPDSKLKLTQYEIEVLTRWIDQGAEWKDHWAFIAPEEPKIPKKRSKWETNPIDHFVLARLKREKLKPSKEASPEKLIRRLSFDLRGIPPNLEEIDRFLADQSDHAYENLVDRFLSDRHYGERMALEWLDVARYADSHGYQDDLERAMWPWRDWVIKAYNENMPYDQFVTWQLAGDLLPDSHYEQKLATGFNRNHKITQEVGVVDEEYRVEYVLDRVNTFSTAFLGLTIACAQCHDHKFDPVSQKEYYQLFSFFNNVPEQGRVEYGVEVAEPALAIPDSTVDKYKSYINALVSKQEVRVDSYEEKKWSAEKDFTYAAHEISGQGKIPEGLIAYYPFDYSDDNQISEETGTAGTGLAVNGPVPMPGKYSGGFEFTGENFFELPDRRGRQLRSFTFSFWLYSIHSGARGIILTPKFVVEGEKPAFELGAYDDGIRLVLNDRRHPDQAIRAETSHILPANKWAHIAITYDGSGHQEGVNIYLNGVPQKLNTYGRLSRSTSIPFEFFVGRKSVEGGWVRVERAGLIRTRLDELMIFNRALSGKEVGEIILYDPLAP